MVFYLLSCPLLILYSLGYIVYPLKDKMVHTGVIHLATWPAGAQVFLEKTHFKDQTPMTIQDLLPGEYTVRIELAGYHQWVHKIRVEDGKAAAFDKILLIPNSWSEKSLHADAFSELTPLQGTEYFLLAQDGQLKNHYVYDWKKDSLRPFPVVDPGLFDFRVSTVFTKEDSSSILIMGGPIWDRKYIYAQMTVQGPEVWDISKLITQRPLDVEWGSGSRDIVFALYDGYVDRLDTVLDSVYPRYVEDVRGWGVYRDQFLVIDRNNSLLVSPVGKKDFKVFLDNRELSDIWSREKDFYDIRPLGSDIVVFLGSHSTIILNHSRPYVIDEPLVGVRLDAGNAKLLMWTRKEIGVIDLSNEENPKSTAAVQANIDWVFVQGKDIRQCFWVYEGSHIIFRDGNQVWLLEPQPQGPAHLEAVTASKENSSVVFVEAKGSLYYLGEHDGRLYSLDIVARKGPELPAFKEDASSALSNKFFNVASPVSQKD